ncbi:MAG: hypothetical protein E6J14_14390 [Chloroflexi bacterium]|nr:MAG: hypothetical protein E6J14_14390 [Chloroflexota bacterium]
MANVQIAVVNASTVLEDRDVAAVVPALQKQVSRDFAPPWGADADLTFVPKDGTPAAGTWWLSVLDNSDQAGALGYHDLTNEGLPLGKIFALSDKQYGLQWTVTASHELLEMLADPDINQTVFVQNDATSGILYMHEVCDACEADKYGYEIDGTLVSDFVFPAWFESFWKPASTRFDYQNQIQAPFTLLPGGYIGLFDVTAGTGWQQQTGAEAAATYGSRPRPGSRRERRRTPRNQWLRSEVRVLQAAG